LGVTGEEIRSSLMDSTIDAAGCVMAKVTPITLIANNVHLVSRQLEGLGT